MHMKAFVINRIIISVVVVVSSHLSSLSVTASDHDVRGAVHGNSDQCVGEVSSRKCQHDPDGTPRL